MSDMKKVDDTLNYYNSKAKDFVSGTVDVTFTEMQDTFLEFIPAGGKILDFGCGSGRRATFFCSIFDMSSTSLTIPSR